MTPELTIVKLFLCYEQWEKYKGRLSVKDLPKEIQPVYSVLDNYHNNNEFKADLSVADLANLLVGHSSKDKDYYLGVLEEIQKLEAPGQGASADTTAKLIHRVLANKHLQEISLAAYDAKEGRMSIEQVQTLFSQFQELNDDQELEQHDNPFISDDLTFLVEQAVMKPGLRWRLKTLNEMLGSLRKGDFGFVFARPETGKTTFLVSEISFMAEQLSEHDGPVLWIKFSPLMW